MSNIYQIKKRKSIKWILDHSHETIHGAKTSRPTAAVHAGTPVTPESRVVTEEGAFSCACHHPRLTFCSRRIPQTLEGRGPLYLASKKYLRVLRDSRQRLEDQRVMVTGFRKCNHGMRLSHRLHQCNSHLPGPSPMLPTSSDVHYPQSPESTCPSISTLQSRSYPSPVTTLPSSCLPWLCSAPYPDGEHIHFTFWWI